jgi:hypothetical protein
MCSTGSAAQNGRRGQGGPPRAPKSCVVIDWHPLDGTVPRRFETGVTTSLFRHPGTTMDSPATSPREPYGEGNPSKYDSLAPPSPAEDDAVIGPPLPLAPRGRVVATRRALVPVPPAETESERLTPISEVVPPPSPASVAKLRGRKIKVRGLKEPVTVANPSHVIPEALLSVGLRSRGLLDKHVGEELSSAERMDLLESTLGSLPPEQEQRRQQLTQSPFWKGKYKGVYAGRGGFRASIWHAGSMQHSRVSVLLLRAVKARPVPLSESQALPSAEGAALLHDAMIRRFKGSGLEVNFPRDSTETQYVPPDEPEESVSSVPSASVASFPRLPVSAPAAASTESSTPALSIALDYVRLIEPTTIALDTSHPILKFRGILRHGMKWRGQLYLKGTKKTIITPVVSHPQEAARLFDDLSRKHETADAPKNFPSKHEVRHEPGSDPSAIRRFQLTRARELAPWVKEQGAVTASDVAELLKAAPTYDEFGSEAGAKAELERRRQWKHRGQQDPESESEASESSARQRMPTPSGSRAESSIPDSDSDGPGKEPPRLDVLSAQRQRRSKRQERRFVPQQYMGFTLDHGHGGLPSNVMVVSKHDKEALASAEALLGPNPSDPDAAFQSSSSVASSSSSSLPQGGFPVLDHEWRFRHWRRQQQKVVLERLGYPAAVMGTAGVIVTAGGESTMYTPYGSTLYDPEDVVEVNDSIDVALWRSAPFVPKALPPTKQIARVLQSEAELHAREFSRQKTILRAEGIDVGEDSDDDEVHLVRAYAGDTTYGSSAVRTDAALVEKCREQMRQHTDLDKDDEKRLFSGLYFIDRLGKDDVHFGVCGACGNGGNVVMCDTCPCVWHQRCAPDLAAEGVPDGDWSCIMCQLFPGHADQLVSELRDSRNMSKFSEFGGDSASSSAMPWASGSSRRWTRAPKDAARLQAERAERRKRRESTRGESDYKGTRSSVRSSRSVVDSDNLDSTELPLPEIGRLRVPSLSIPWDGFENQAFEPPDRSWHIPWLPSLPDSLSRFVLDRLWSPADRPLSASPYFPPSMVCNKMKQVQAMLPEDFGRIGVTIEAVREDPTGRKIAEALGTLPMRGLNPRTNAAFRICVRIRGGPVYGLQSRDRLLVARAHDALVVALFGTLMDLETSGAAASNAKPHMWINFPGRMPEYIAIAKLAWDRVAENQSHYQPTDLPLAYQHWVRGPEGIVNATMSAMYRFLGKHSNVRARRFVSMTPQDMVEDLRMCGFAAKLGPAPPPPEDNDVSTRTIEDCFLPDIREDEEAMHAVEVNSELAKGPGEAKTTTPTAQEHVAPTDDTVAANEDDTTAANDDDEDDGVSSSKQETPHKEEEDEQEQDQEVEARSKDDESAAPATPDALEDMSPAPSRSKPRIKVKWSTGAPAAAEDEVNKPQIPPASQLMMPPPPRLAEGEDTVGSLPSAASLSIPVRKTAKPAAPELKLTKWLTQGDFSSLRVGLEDSTVWFPPLLTQLPLPREEGFAKTISSTSSVLKNSREWFPWVSAVQQGAVVEEDLSRVPVEARSLVPTGAKPVSRADAAGLQRSRADLPHFRGIHPGSTKFSVPTKCGTSRVVVFDSVDRLVAAVAANATYQGASPDSDDLASTTMPWLDLSSQFHPPRGSKAVSANVIQGYGTGEVVTGPLPGNALALSQAWHVIHSSSQSMALFEPDEEPMLRKLCAALGATCFAIVEAWGNASEPVQEGRLALSRPWARSGMTVQQALAELLEVPVDLRGKRPRAAEDASAAKRPKLEDSMEFSVASAAEHFPEDPVVMASLAKWAVESPLVLSAASFLTFQSTVKRSPAATLPKTTRTCYRWEELLPDADSSDDEEQDATPPRRSLRGPSPTTLKKLAPVIGETIQGVWDGKVPLHGLYAALSRRLHGHAEADDLSGAMLSSYSDDLEAAVHRGCSAMQRLKRVHPPAVRTLSSEEPAEECDPAPIDLVNL